MHIMAEENIVDVSWQGSYQGKQSYTPWCEADIIIISQNESLQVTDAVPRRKCDLTDDDKKYLERLNISASSGFDDATIMAKRYALDKRCTVAHTERGTPQNMLSKGQVLQTIKDTMMKSTKSARKQ